MFGSLPPAERPDAGPSGEHEGVVSMICVEKKRSSAELVPEEYISSFKLVSESVGNAILVSISGIELYYVL